MERRMKTYSGSESPIILRGSCWPRLGELYWRRDVADIIIVASRAVPDRPHLAQNVRVNERVARRPRLPGSAWEPKKKRDRSKRPWRTWARVDDVMAARRRSFPRSLAHPLGLERSPLCERCSTATTASQGAHVFAFRLSMLTVDFLLPSEPHRSSFRNGQNLSAER